MNQKNGKVSIDVNSDLPRIQCMSDSTSSFVRAGTVIGTPFRAIEELVRNSITHGRCSNVVITLSHDYDADIGKRMIIEVKDDGCGLTEESVRDMIGVQYCSSESSSSKGESLKSIADLCVEFCIQSIHGVRRRDELNHDSRDRQLAILTAPSKRKRQDTNSLSSNSKAQYSHFINCEKIIRFGKVFKFQSNRITSDILDENRSGTGTIIRLYGFFHQHYVRQKQYLRTTTHNSTFDDELRLTQIKSCVQTLAMAFPCVGIRLCSTSPFNGTTGLHMTREHSVWNRPSLESRNPYYSDSDSSQYWSDCVMVRFRQLISDRVNDKTASFFTVNYEENNDDRNELIHTNEISKTRWKVNGVLCLDSSLSDQFTASSKTTSRPRSFELVYANQRILKSSSFVADTLQKLFTQLYGSKSTDPWMFLLHISCPNQDLDIIVDETKSYTSIRQKDRLSNLMTDAITNGFQCSSRQESTRTSTSCPTSSVKQNKHDVKSSLFYSSRIICGEKSDQRPSKACNGSSPFTDAFFKSSKSIPNVQPVEFSTKPTVSTLPWTRSRLKALDEDAKRISAVHKDKDFHELKITKDMLSRCQFIGQVDMKYILVNMDGILCAIDQHAADERVGLERLERLLDSIINENGREKLESIKLSKLNEVVRRESFLKSIRLGKTDPLIISPNQVSVVLDCDELLRKWRFDFDIDIHKRTIILKAVPGIYDKVATSKDFIQFIQLLEARASDAICCTPAFVNRTLASFACRYAIMFGDRLDSKRCTEIVEELSKCDLSFICAHGRPSLVPLVDMNMLQKEENSTKSDHSLPLRFQITRMKAYGVS